jgi:hypothetical protein
VAASFVPHPERDDTLWSTVEPGSGVPRVLIPRDVALFGGIILGATVLSIAVMVWLGIAWHGMPSRYFREHQAGTYYSGLLLLGTSGLAWGAARRAGMASSRRFWAVAALGFVFLALDDVLRIHEETDRLFHRLVGWDPDHWLTDHLDDAIVALYGMVAATWAYRYRAGLLHLRRTNVCLAAGFALFVGMTVLDVLGTWPTVEDSLKLLAEAAIITGVFAAFRDPVLRAGPL